MMAMWVHAHMHCYCLSKGKRQTGLLLIALCSVGMQLLFEVQELDYRCVFIDYIHFFLNNILTVSGKTNLIAL